MSPTTLLRVLALLAALLVVWGATALFRGGVGDDPTPLDLPALTPADVDRVMVEAGDTARLEAGLTGWTVNGHRADQEQVTDLLTALADTGLTSELVSRNAQSHQRLGVDSASGRRLRFLKGDRLLVDLVFGNQGRGYQSAYVRRAGDDRVYLLRGRLASMAEQTAESWRDRTIATVVGDSVRAVRIERGRRVTALARGDSGWTVDGAPADSAEVAKLLGTLAEITAAGFATDVQADSLDFTRARRRLVATGARGDTLLGLAFDSTAAGIWVRHLSGGPVFRIDSWRVDQIMPPDSALRKRAG